MYEEHLLSADAFCILSHWNYAPKQPPLYNRLIGIWIRITVFPANRALSKTSQSFFDPCFPSVSLFTAPPHRSGCFCSNVLRPQRQVSAVIPFLQQILSAVFDTILIHAVSHDVCFSVSILASHPTSTPVFCPPATSEALPLQRSSSSQAPASADSDAAFGPVGCLFYLDSSFLWRTLWRTPGSQPVYPKLFWSR